MLHHYNSLSNKMDNSLLAVRDINHKYIVVGGTIILSIGICDDDIHMLTYLAELCQKILPKCKVEMYQTGSDFLSSQVNFEKVEKYDRKSVVLSDGTNLILAKNRSTEFVDAYLHFLKNDFMYQLRKEC